MWMIVCHIIIDSFRLPALMNVFSRWIELMPMIAVASLTLSTDALTWLSHVNASVLKVKLATAIIGISSIHLLKTFINAGNLQEKMMMWQTIIHITFLLSAIAIAYTDKLLNDVKPAAH